MAKPFDYSKWDNIEVRKPRWIRWTIRGDDLQLRCAMMMCLCS